MKKLYDLLVKIGTYEKDGKNKNSYLNIGVIMEGDKGQFMLLKKTFNPAGIMDGKDSVIVSMFSKENKSEEPKGSDQQTINPEDIAWEE